MKKIMIAAALAAVGFGAVADNCTPEKTVTPSAQVYVWKFTGKTTTGKAAKVAGNNSSCNPTKGADCTYRVKASLKIQGYTYGCDIGCADDGENLGIETGSLWTAPNEVFLQKKPYKSVLKGGVITELAHLIGKSKKQVEIGGITDLTEVEGGTYALVYAGFGKAFTKNSRRYVKSAKGNFAGFLSQPWAYNVKKDMCYEAGFWRCDTLALECEAPTVAFGKWSVKYSKSGSKKGLAWIEKKVKMTQSAWPNAK